MRQGQGPTRVAKLQVKNWTQYQGYQRRGPKWIKLYTSLLDDVGWITLPVAAKVVLPILWLVAATQGEDGLIPAEPSLLATLSRLPEADISAGIPILIDMGFLQVVEARRQRQKSRGPSDTPVHLDRGEKRKEETEREGEERRRPATTKAPLDGPRKNPLVSDREALIQEGYALIRHIAGAVGKDPTEILGEASTGGGRWKGGRKASLDPMTDDRLVLTVQDLREMWARVRPAEDVAGEPSPLEAWFAQSEFRDFHDLAEKYIDWLAAEPDRPLPGPESWKAFASEKQLPGELTFSVLNKAVYHAQRLREKGKNHEGQEGTQAGAADRKEAAQA